VLPAVSGRLGIGRIRKSVRAAIDQRLVRMEGDFKKRLAKIERHPKLLSWMDGFNLAATVGVSFIYCATGPTAPQPAS
jgi:hypothetical protein